MIIKVIFFIFIFYFLLLLFYINLIEVQVFNFLYLIIGYDVIIFDNFIMFLCLFIGFVLVSVGVIGLVLVIGVGFFSIRRFFVCIFIAMLCSVLITRLFERLSTLLHRIHFYLLYSI